MLTNIYMKRQHLITKENMEYYCDGKNDQTESVNDDLDSLFEDICLDNESNGRFETYFLPKLTQNELELAETKDKDFINTFARNWRADVPKVEMKRSESDSKFVFGWCLRTTVTIENSFKRKITSCQ